MRMTSINALLLGIAIGAIAVGATTVVTAAGDSTITACASKSTGTMRLLSKGSCKKTETRVSWNQQGPQGLPGANGAAGSAGPKGDAGNPGINGQNFFVVDAEGKKLGQYLTTNNNNVEFILNGRRWTVSPYRYAFVNNYGSVVYYSDALCTSRLISVPKDDLVLPDTTIYEYNQTFDSGLDGSIEKAFIPANTTRQLPTSFSNLYRGGEGAPCTSVDSANKVELESSRRLVAATEIAKPTYTAPLSIVSQ